MGNQHGSINKQLKPFPLNPEYLVSTEGFVVSPTGLKRFGYGHLGYKRLSIPVGNKSKHLLVHRVVALTYLPNPNNLPEVNHINGVKTDNRVINLEWVSREDNMQHAFSKGLNTNVGANNGKAILKEEDVIIIYNKLLSGRSVTELCAEYNLSKGCIAGIKSKKNWSTLLAELEDIPIGYRSVCITPEQKDKCKALRLQGLTCRQMSEILGITLSQAERVFSSK